MDEKKYKRYSIEIEAVEYKFQARFAYTEE